MDKKGAIELSMNFLVVLIISIVIFGFGIRFIYNLSKEADNLREVTIEDLDKGIGNLVCEGSDRVCIGVDRKTIRRAKFDVFGINIVNINDNEYFEIEVSPSDDFPPSPTQSIGFRKDKSPITHPPNPILIVNPGLRGGIKIEKNDEKTVAIGVEVPANAVSGTYILNVYIKQSGQDYVPVQKLYVEVP